MLRVFYCQDFEGLEVVGSSQVFDGGRGTVARSGVESATFLELDRPPHTRMEDDDEEEEDDEKEFSR